MGRFDVGKNSDFIGVEEFGRGQRQPRAIKEPGTFWEYNDVRINRMSLTLLQVWQKALPQVLKSEVMDRIGASNTWQYHGYFNSQVKIKNKMVDSGERRHALGRRSLDQQSGHGALRLSDPASGEVER